MNAVGWDGVGEIGGDDLPDPRREAGGTTVALDPDVR
jgi:hypothetical protein